jgi:hypothetical protein
MDVTCSSHGKDVKYIGYRPPVREFEWKKQLVMLAIARRILLR